MILKDRALIAGSALLILGCIAGAYWPASHSGFVWDDTSSLHDTTFLRGGGWREVAFQGFDGWVNYFRPLVVLLFALETRAFNVEPGPMHVVSIGIHLANTALVGMLALRLSSADLARPLWFVGISMLFYGLHPALIEPVDWIGCQVELALIFFMLLGLLLNATIQSARWRAFAVGLSFLFAASCKEAAIAFPLLLVLFDLNSAPQAGWSERLRAVWQRQRGVYVCVLIAGIVYLAARHRALGYTALVPASEGLLSLSRLQRVCLTYLSYWKLITWPMTSIGLLHSIDEHRFADLTVRSLALDAAAVAVVLTGVYAFWKRWPLGVLVLAVSIALLPVLNLIPIGFNEGLYHDRYAATAIAVGCILLPSLLGPIFSRPRISAMLVLLVATVWLGFAFVNIRITIPLWADELALWRWALQQDPHSITAKSHLLSTYIGRNDHAHAREVADELMVQAPECTVCMLNAASLAISENDASRATLALSRLDNSKTIAYNKDLLQGYVLARGGLLELQGDLPGAESAYLYAVKLDPQNPVSRVTLATLLAKEGKVGEAQEMADTAIPLFAPDERERRRTAFEQVLAGAKRR